MDKFFSEALSEHRGSEEWAKVVELLAVNRLCSPGSELAIHERWFDRTAMDFLLNSGPEIAGKDRLYQTLDKIVEHKDGLERHLGQRWKDLFNARTDVVLYDLTSTYFEGAAEECEKAKRGYSRDHRPDCPQVVLALVVTPEGFPLTYEVIRVPSKSQLDRYFHWLPQEQLDLVIGRLIRAASEVTADGKANRLGLANDLELGTVWLDSTCVEANVHYPVDWVLLRDATRTLMKATALIRRHGLKHRMQEPRYYFAGDEPAVHGDDAVGQSGGFDEGPQAGVAPEEGDRWGGTPTCPAAS